MIEPSEAVLSDLKNRYGEPQRHYHTWDHIQALLRHFQSVQPNLHDPSAVLWALYWHDAIYDPQAGDNEDQSADLLHTMAPPDLPAPVKDRADRIIRATKQHLVPDGLHAEEQSDLELFLDMDLSILATTEPVFDAYEAQIRAEYAFVPDAAYRQGRGAILNGFLARERLYFSDTFYDQWESRARANLARSIARLEAEDDTNDG